MKQKGIEHVVNSIAKGWLKAALSVFWAAILVGPANAESKEAATTPAEAAFDRAYEAEQNEDFVAARKQYLISGDGGIITACYNLGVLHDFGKGGPENDSEANRLYVMACDADDALACNNLGSQYLHGEVVSKDLAKAKALFEKACRGKDGLGCVNLGDMIVPDEENLSLDDVRYKQAYDYYAMSCGLNHARGCLRMGYALATGTGTKTDMKAAHTAYTRACEGEEGAACYNLGIIHENGRGVPKSLAKAIGFYDKACTLEDSDGCAAVGEIYFAGEGVTKDVLKGASYLDKACNLDRAQSCNQLGHDYMDEETLPIDYAKSDKLYAKSCALDNAAGCALRASPILLIDQAKMLDGSAIIEAKKWVARSHELEKDNETAKEVESTIVEVEQALKKLEDEAPKSLTSKIFGK